MGISLKVIARSDTATPLGASTDDNFGGLGTVANEDHLQDVKIMSHPGSAAPTATEVLVSGSRIGARSEATQNQLQDPNSSTSPVTYYVTAIPLPTLPGDTIPRGAEVLGLGAASWVTAPFVLPAVNSSATASVTDPSWVSDLTLPADVYMSGAGIVTLTAVDLEASTLTFTYNGVPAAAVTVLA